MAGLFFAVAAAALVVCGHKRQGLYIGLAAALALSVPLPRAYAPVNRGFASRLDSIEVEIMCLPQILDETPGG